MDLEQFQSICPNLSNEKVADYFPWLIAAMAEFEIDNPLRIAAFIAQTAHESGEFSRFTENLNYSANRLLAVFPRYFNLGNVNQYARQPEKIANYIYANRMGNDDEASGDGWKYRGHGILQITGKENHKLAGKALGIDLENNPERAADIDVAFRAAGWFWSDHNLNDYADEKKFKVITHKINGGENGLEDRLKYYNLALAVLGAE